MSAAATAAGYLYASGRLRGRNAREQEDTHAPKDKPAPREKIRVAVLPPEPQQEKAKRTPKIEYRTRRRWSPE
ncbi:MAG: hypothetical protein K0R40_1134 [Burkholderiales bacterium]|jgi:hypothetical protein|nr:hypothetical protein [Burkholderiales bacterium]